MWVGRSTPSPQLGRATPGPQPTGSSLVPVAGLMVSRVVCGHHLLKSIGTLWSRGHCHSSYYRRGQSDKVEHRSHRKKMANLMARSAGAKIAGPESVRILSVTASAALPGGSHRDNRH